MNRSDTLTSENAPGTPAATAGYRPTLEDLLPGGDWTLVAPTDELADRALDALVFERPPRRRLTLERDSGSSVELGALPPSEGILVIVSRDSWAATTSVLREAGVHRGPLVTVDLDADASATLTAGSTGWSIWLQGSHQAVLAHVSRSMRPDRPSATGPCHPPVQVRRTVRTIDVQRSLPVIDLRTHNPMRWTPSRARNPSGTASLRSSHPVAEDATRLITEAVRGAITSADPATLDRVGHLLGTELLALLRAGHCAGGTAATTEHQSLRVRRAAMRAHGGLPRAAAGADPATVAPIEVPVSILLVSRRPDYLPVALATALRQRHRPLEVVLVAHGMEPPVLPPDRPEDVPITVLSCPADVSLGVALRHATDAASGTLVTKMDDDDFYGPDHVTDVAFASVYSAATLVGKMSEYVYLGGLDVTMRRQVPIAERYGGHIAGGTITVGRADLKELGGWARVPRAVDTRMIDRALRAGGSIYRTSSLGFVFNRHGEGHTYPADASYFLAKAVEQRHGLDLGFAGIVDEDGAGTT